MTAKKIITCLMIAAGAVPPSQALAASPPRPWLGMGAIVRSEPQGGRFLYVAHAPSDTPAYRAGLRPGDLITAIDGKKIGFRDDLDMMEFTSRLRIGSVLRLRVVRAGKSRELQLRVGTLPPAYEQRWIDSLQRARDTRSRARGTS
ncbi:MAG TPA: PDZ domain-containing protein [Thermoanaerobaculia bacterium]|jgi:S1-C subfamily serine protease